MADFLGSILNKMDPQKHGQILAKKDNKKIGLD